MTEPQNLGFRDDFKRFFIRGLATLLPTVLTIVVLFKCYEFIQQNISVHIVEGIIKVVLFTTEDYPKIDIDDVKNYRRSNDLASDYPEITDADITSYFQELGLEADTLLDERLTGEIRQWKLATGDEIRFWKMQKNWNSGPRALVGFIIAIILVYILGRLLGSFLGRRLYQMFERTVQQIPGIKQVYHFVKQVTEFLIGDKKLEFSRVVAVPYPREGIWSIGLVTGAGFRRVKDKTQLDLLTIFIPSSPTPVTGYVIYVKKEEVIDLPITIEEALRFTASGGVIVPDHQALPKEQETIIQGPLTPKESSEGKSDRTD